ncbi:hypothetical protein HNO53_12945 [Billgrantia antri]|uniref:Uncharacterized protein n=1 Tax=Halomonas sulfidivorans TaxID=2733488 RepID=A0ABX7WGK8_9GAMM|nr:hypothetical protein [Halomonas sulfidivorans]QTP59543.1 hypothetical protein HNO53_12945 [Halomonas sulfidivorans]
MEKVKVQKGDRVLYVNANAVENMKKFGFEAEAKTARKATARKNKKEDEVVSDESASE